MPGVLVAIGLNSPLNSAGPCGFMSKVSCCEAPPVRNRKMTAFGRLRGPAVAAARSPETSAIDSPRAPIVPACRNTRRFSNGWCGLVDVCMVPPARWNRACDLVPWRSYRDRSLPGRKKRRPGHSPAFSIREVAEGLLSLAEPHPGKDAFLDHRLARSIDHPDRLPKGLR